MKNLSIIICTHNRSALVKKLVLSFNDQKGLSPETEIIVVASGCTDNTVITIDNISNKIKAKVVIKDVQEPGLSIARNAGLEIANRDYIAFLDDDIRLFPGWIEGLKEAFNAPDSDVVGGCIRLWWDGMTEPDWLHYYHKRLLGFNDHGDKIKPIESGNIFGGNFAIKKEVYKKIGGFSTRLGRIGSERLAGEEAEYFLRAKEAGFKFIYSPHFIVEHLVNKERASIEYLANSALGVGKSKTLQSSQVNNASIKLMYDKLNLLFDEANNEIREANNPTEYMFHKVRRFDVLGETLGILNNLFGEVDLSENILAEYPLGNSENKQVKKVTDKPFIPKGPKLGNDFLITVIIPCFNVESHIDTCLTSLAKQTLDQKLFEVICVDDCSTDETVKIIESFKSKIKNITLITHNENKKQGAARNTGLNRAKGEYITFLDSDDYLTIKALETLISNVKGKDLLVAQLQFIYMQASNKNKVSKREIQGNSGISALSGVLGWWPVSMLVSRDLIVKNDIKFREGVFFEDIDFVIAVALAAQSSHVINEVVYNYIQHAESTVNRLDEKKLDDSAKAISYVFGSLIHRNNHTEYQNWVTASSKWLLYQFDRINLQNTSQEKLAQLIEHFCITLMANRLFILLGADFQSSVINKVTASFGLEISPQPSNFPSSNTVNKLIDLKVYSVALLKLEDLTDLHPNGKTIEENIKLSESKVNEALASKKDVLLKKSYRLNTIDYLLIPHNHYHAHNLGRIAIALSKQGLRCKLLKMAPPHPDEGAFIEEYKDYYISLSDVLYCEVLPAGIVVMNDWENNVATKLIEWANSNDIATYAIVEGVNDYNDVDTGKKRKAYQRVRNLFLNGEFDRKYFTANNQRIAVVGIDRLDTLYQRVKKIDNLKKTRKATINLNFTYGVLEEHAEQWLNDIIGVCEEISLPFIISKHPSDKVYIGDYPVTKRPLYDELIENEIFITRFSGAVFEALIAGCKVIYYNPHIEKIDKFIDPMGAYLYVDSKYGLQKAMKDIDKGWCSESDEFLKVHTGDSYSLNSYVKTSNSLIKTTKLLYDDATANKSNINPKKNYFNDKQFNDFRKQAWAWQYYPILIEPEKSFISEVVKNTRTLEELSPLQDLGCKLFGLVFKPSITKQNQRKLKNTPITFFQDSKHPVTRVYGKLIRVI